MIILAVMHYSCSVILGFLDFSEKRFIISIFILFETLVWFFNANLDRKAKVTYYTLFTPRNLFKTRHPNHLLVILKNQTS